MTTLTTTNQAEVTTADMVAAGIIPSGTPQAQITIFLAVANETGLSPTKKEIYLVSSGGKFFNIVSVGGLRSVAEKTGAYMGIDPVKYDLKGDGTFKMQADYPKGQYPTSVTCTVYRNVGGVKCPFTATIQWNEYIGQSFMTKQKPYTMAEKTAEVHALRKAFATLNNIYEEQELAAINGEVSQPLELPKSANQTVPIDKVKELLSPEHPKWHEAVKYMSGANAKIQKVLDKYEISETDIEYLQTLNIDVTA